MICFALLIFTLFFEEAGRAFAQGSQFQTTIGGASYDYGRSIIQTSDGGYAIAGFTQSFGAGNTDIYIVKSDGSGALQWARTAGGANTDIAEGIVQTSDGGYAIAGYTNSLTGAYDVYLVKSDGSGTLQWARTVGGGGTDQGYSAVQTSDGGYAIAGFTDSFGSGSNDIYIVKLDGSGALQWTRTVGGTNSEEGRSIIKTSDGGYAIAGFTWSFGAGNTDFYIVKLDGSGNLQWTRTVGGANTDIAQSIVQTSDGGYALAGRTSSFGAGNDDFYIVKLDGSGNLQWARTVGGASTDIAYGIIQTSDGGYAIAGQTYSFGAGIVDVYIVKLDGSGTLQWTRTVGGTSSQEEGRSIIQTSDGGYAIAGFTDSFGAGVQDFYIIKSDGNGNTCANQGTGGVSGLGGTAASGGVSGSGGSGGTVGTGGTGGTATNVCVTLAASITFTNISCSGQCTGTATANLSGGTLPFTYSWNTSPVQTTQTATGLCVGTYSVLVTDAASATAAATVAITQPAAITATITATPATCGNNNGSANVTASGGTGNLTYSWSPSGGSSSSATGLGAGNCTVIVTDANGCFTTSTATITSSGSIPTASVTSTSASCGNSNGSAAANISGGTAPYTYTWNNGQTTSAATGLSAGTYSIMVADANGCTQTQTVNVSSAASTVLITVNSTSTGCAAATGTANANASGGTAPYTYNWNNGASTSSAAGLAGGTYTVTVTDATGCTAVQTVNVSQSPAITAAASSTPSACNSNNGTASTSASGGTSPYTYLWNPSGQTTTTVTGLSTGTHTIIITDAAGCTQTATVSVTQTGGPTATATATATTLTQGQSATLTASGGGTYFWSPATGLSCTNCSNPTVTPPFGGQGGFTYCVTVADGNNCTGTACVTVTVEINCGNIFVPNAFSPNDDDFNDFECVFGTNCISEMKFIIYDRWGEKVFEYSGSPLPSGGAGGGLCWDGIYKGKLMNTATFVYYLQATLTNGEQINKKGNISLIR